LFNKTTPKLQDQDQDHSLQDQDQRPRPIFWSQTGLVLRPTVSDHITGEKLHSTKQTGKHMNKTELAEVTKF